MSGRIKLLLVALACAAPFMLATLAYHYGWSPGKPGNYGELIVPKALSGAPFDALRGKWILVSFDHPACDGYCERKLYYMRQVRKAQGREQSRLERLWILTGQGAPSQRLLGAMEGTHVVTGKDALATQFPGKAADHIYLVDPLGNLMLRYPRDPEPRLMIKDLQRLLKYSRAG